MNFINYNYLLTIFLIIKNIDHIFKSHYIEWSFLIISLYLLFTFFFLHFCFVLPYIFWAQSKPIQCWNFTQSVGSSTTRQSSLARKALHTMVKAHQACFLPNLSQGFLSIGLILLLGSYCSRLQWRNLMGSRPFLISLFLFLLYVYSVNFEA